MIIVLTFSVNNLETVDLKYYNLKFELKIVTAPLLVILLGSTFGGFFLASLFGIVNNIRFKNTIRKQNQTIKNLDKRIVKLTLNSSLPSGEPK